MPGRIFQMLPASRRQRLLTLTEPLTEPLVYFDFALGSCSPSVIVRSSGRLQPPGTVRTILFAVDFEISSRQICKDNLIKSLRSPVTYRHPRYAKESDISLCSM